MSFHQILTIIHIISAIIGMGPGFILTTIAKSGKNMTELRHSYAVRNKLHIFVMIGGTLLLVTGLLMGALDPSLFRKGWYDISLILFLIGLASGPILLAPSSKPVKQLLASHQGEEIPEEYWRLTKKLFRYEHLANFIFIIIIILMITKPF